MDDTKFKYQYWLLKQVDEDVLNIIYDADIENKIEESQLPWSKDQRLAS